MAVDVFAADEQRDLPVDVDRWVALSQDVLRAEGVEHDTEVSLLFVDEATIAALHERFMGLPGPTDVLSFPIDDEPTIGGRSPDQGGTGPGDGGSDEVPNLLGDVVICPAVAARNAVEHGVPVEDELALLVVHGLLHLLGMDHEEDAEAEVMERRERLLLERYHHRGPDDPGAGVVGAVDDTGRMDR